MKQQEQQFRVKKKIVDNKKQIFEDEKKIQQMELRACQGFETRKFMVNPI
jgi:hypothetical protein